MKKKYTFRLFPTEVQKELIETNCFCSKFIYEYYIKKIQYDEETECLEFGKDILEFEYDKYITQLKKNDNYSFLKESSSLALQGGMRKLFHDIYISRKSKKEKYPSYKLPVRQQIAYSMKQSKNENHFYLCPLGIKIPKIGVIQMNQTTYIPYTQKIEEITIYRTKTGMHYITIFFFEDEKKE